MRRIIIQGLLAWLIGLLPLLAAGQTLTRYEYWFDNDFAHRVSGSLSGTEREVNKRVSTDGLSDGIHRINFRARQSDGSYSAITSSVFLKLDKPANTVLEYWFDDNYDQRESIPISANGEEESLSLDLRSNTKYPFGFHWLKLRAVVAGAGTTSVCTEPVLKLSAGVANKLDYWIDGDISNMRTLEGNNASDGNGYVYVTDLDLQDVSPGYHRLYCRTRSSSGYTSSAVTMTPFIKVTSGIASTLEYWVDNDRSNVRTLAGVPASDGNGYVFTSQLDMRSVDPGYHVLYFRARSENGGTSTSTLSSGFLKLASGAASRLEYWLDGDRSNVRVLNGTQASDGNGYVFVDDLDLGDVTPGHHRLYCRARSGSGGTATAVTMTPIIVKSLYHQEVSTAAVVKKYSVVVDDEAEVIYNLPHPKDDYDFNYIFDARYLSKGKHKVKASFWNSYGMSTYAEQEFTVKEPEEPKITLSASEKDGVVSLTYDYKVPNNVKHRVLRVYENGTKTKVFDEDKSVSDGIYTVTDAPPAGQSVYHVLSQYQKYDGSYKNVLSNEVTVNVTKSQDDLSKYGYIIGYVPQSNALLKYVVYSDGKHDLVNGEHFRREMIEVGKELTIEVHESQTLTDNYYEPVTLTVHEGENSVSIKQLTGDDRPDDFINHLAFASDLEWVGQEFKFKVTNISREKWTGRVRFRAISKAQDALPDDSGSLNPGGDAGTQAGAVAPMPSVTVEKNYYYSYSEPISIWPGGTADVTLSLQGVFPDDKKEYYVFYIESEGQWRDGVDAGDEIRLLAIDESYNIDKNPFVRFIDKSALEYAEEEVLQQDAEYAANLILMVTNYIKSFDGILGKVIETSEIVKQLSLDEVSISKTQYNAMMEEALNSETWDEFLKSDVVKKAPVTVFADFGSGLTMTLRQDILNDILKYGKDINKYLGKAMKLLKEVKQFQEEDNYDRTFHCADKILDLADDAYPLLKIVKPYIDVTRIVISKALAWGESYYGVFQAQNLYDNIPSAGENREYNRHVDFKIKVKKDGRGSFNFEKEGTEQIRDVKVMFANKGETFDPQKVDTICFDLVGVSDGVMLKQTRYIGINPSTAGGNIEENVSLKRMWMEIKWKNGRTTKVPLVSDNKCSGVHHERTTMLDYYTVTLHSKSSIYENIADKIQIKD